MLKFFENKFIITLIVEKRSTLHIFNEGSETVGLDKGSEKLLWIIIIINKPVGIARDSKSMAFKPPYSYCLIIRNSRIHVMYFIFLYKFK